MKRITTLFLTTLPFFAFAQSNFTVNPDTVVAIKPADLFVFYNYAQFENLTDDTLQIRWVKLEETMTGTGGGHGGSSVDWSIAITDPSNTYDPATGVDSADFHLGPDWVPTDKFIYQLFPNDDPGTLYAKFLFYDVNNPDDNAVVDYFYTATEPANNADEALLKNGLKIYPQPAADFFIIENEENVAQNIQLFNVQGEKIQSFNLSPLEQRQIDVIDLPNGIYFLRLEHKRQLNVIKLIINHS